MFDTGPVPRSPSGQATRRWLAVAVGVVAMALTLGGLFTHQLLVDETVGYTMRCGLKQCEAQVGAESIVMSTIELTTDSDRAGSKASAAWGYSGTIAWWAGLVGLVGLALAIGMVALARYVRLPVISPTTIALLGAAIALISGCVFVATKPEGVGVTRVGWTFWAFGAGVIGTVLSAFLLSRQLALLEPEFDPGESPEAPADEPWQDP